MMEQWGLYVGFWIGGFLVGFGVSALVGSWLHRRKHIACIIRPGPPRSMARPMPRSRMRSLLSRIKQRWERSQPYER